MASRGLDYYMKAQAIFLISLLLTNLVNAQQNALRIAVLSGNGARQYIKQKVHTEPVIEVEDEKGSPVDGASVEFTLPSDGPGGTFENGSKVFRTTTDAHGRVTLTGLRLNRIPGPFNIHLTASSEGKTGTATIAQVSVKGSHRGGVLGISTRTWLLAGLVLVAVAGGIVAAKELKPGRNPNVLTATPGTPVVGGPQ